MEVVQAQIGETGMNIVSRSGYLKYVLADDLFRRPRAEKKKR
jgi:hypothetical protein